MAKEQCQEVQLIDCLKQLVAVLGWARALIDCGKMSSKFMEWTKEAKGLRARIRAVVRGRQFVGVRALVGSAQHP
eukprot:9786252-Lingulodinium_polyedra.AAC.1